MQTAIVAYIFEAVTFANLVIINKKMILCYFMLPALYNTTVLSRQAMYKVTNGAIADYCRRWSIYRGLCRLL